MAQIINTTYPQYGKDFGDAMYKETLKGYEDRETAYKGGYGNTIAGYERLYANQDRSGEYDQRIAEKAYKENFGNIQQELARRGLSHTSEYGVLQGGEFGRYQDTSALIRDKVRQ